MTIHFSPELDANLRYTACGLDKNRERREPLHLTVTSNDVTCGRCKQTQIFRSFGSLSVAERREVIAIADQLAAGVAEYLKTAVDE